MATKKATKAEAAQAPEPIEPQSYDWRGVEHWRCPVCGRDSGNKAVIAQHIAAAHTRKPSPLAPAVESTEEGNGAANPDQNDGAGAEPDGGSGGDVHG